MINQRHQLLRRQAIRHLAELDKVSKQYRDASIRLSCEGLIGSALGDTSNFDRDTQEWKKFADSKLPYVTENTNGFYLSRNDLLRMLCQQDSNGICDVEGIFIYYGLENDATVAVGGEGLSASHVI